MYQDFENMPALRVMPKVIEATCYNHVRLALRRMGIPLRVRLADHRGLEIILNKDSWVCVDSGNNDQIIMAWSEFDTSKHNYALHLAVPCQLRLYHICAGLVMGSALDALDQSLIDELANTRGRSDHRHRVINAVQSS